MLVITRAARTRPIRLTAALPFAYLSRSHPVYGKPVRFRRCPATVSGDEGPFCHRVCGKAGPSENPKPGDRPGDFGRKPSAGEVAAIAPGNSFGAWLSPFHPRARFAAGPRGWTMQRTFLFSIICV